MPKSQQRLLIALRLKNNQVVEEDDEGEPVIDDALEKFSTIPIVYMTGTFGKPKSAFKIPDENTVVWSYANVQKAKMLDENIEYFIRGVRSPIIANTGIFTIYTKNGKVYIGKSNDVEKRWKEHRKSLDNNNHHNYKLQENWNGFGEDCFMFEVLEDIKNRDSFNVYLKKFMKKS